MTDHFGWFHAGAEAVEREPVEADVPYMHYPFMRYDDVRDDVCGAADARPADSFQPDPAAASAHLPHEHDVWAGISFVVIRGGSMKGSSGMCVALMIMMGVTYVSYTIWPKGPYMLSYLTGREQVQAWLRMYRDMMKLYHIGMVCGVLGYAILVWNRVMARASAGVDAGDP